MTLLSFLVSYTSTIVTVKSPRPWKYIQGEANLKTIFFLLLFTLNLHITDNSLSFLVLPIYLFWVSLSTFDVSLGFITFLSKFSLKFFTFYFIWKFPPVSWGIPITTNNIYIQKRGKSWGRKLFSHFSVLDVSRMDHFSKVFQIDNNSMEISDKLEFN